MCGIVGSAGDLGVKEEGMFKQLLVVDSLRGTDSTGVAVVGTGREVKIAKTVGDTYQLLDCQSFTKAMSGKNHVLIGHNRFGTVGKTSRKNAHPFHFDKVTGVHNGTLRNKYKLPDAHNFETDSEALYSHINKVGIDEAMKEVDGAYALVWYNKDTNTLNMLRNKERPMNFAFSKDKKALFFASEAWMMQAIALRESYSLDEIQELPEDSLYQFEIPAVGHVFEKAKVRHVKPTPFSQTKVVTPASPGWKGSTVVTTKKADTVVIPGAEIDDLRANFYRMSTHGSYFVIFKSEQFPKIEFRLHVDKAVEARKIVQSDLVYSGTVGIVLFEEGNCIAKIRSSSFLETEIILPVVKTDHKGNPLSEEEFNKKYANCAWCTAPIEYDQDFHVIDETDCICSDCTSDPQVKQFLGIKV